MTSTSGRLQLRKFTRLFPGVRRWTSTLPRRKPSQALPDSPARTRFAPSPTGYLHLGSLRTALYNYLLAKATGGQFLLRVEDTDKSRTVQGAEDRICDGLSWAGLQWDEGPRVGGPFGPYRQSERGTIYKEHAKVILESDHAYRCFCSPERLNQLAEARSKLGLPTDYDRTCAGISKEESCERAHRGESHVVRLKAPSPVPPWQDLIYGKVGNVGKPKRHIQDREGYDDPILVKSDGMPTYHFANVVDDHLMRVTHVVRAVEWMPSTPKHLAIYDAFGWQPPAFAHVGLLQSEAGQKLSKRNFDADLQSYIDKGYFPEALVNFVALLGWSHTQKSDFLPLKNLVSNFNLKFTKGNTIVKLLKLDFLQSQYSQKYAAEDGPDLDAMVSQVTGTLSQRAGNELSVTGEAFQAISRALVMADAKNFTTVEAFVDRNIYFFSEPPVPTPSADIARTRLEHAQTIYDALDRLDEAAWEDATIKSVLDDLTGRFAEQAVATDAKQSQIDTKKAASSHLSRYLRWALMGGRSGPPMVSTVKILGRKRTLERLKNANQVELYD